MTANRRRISGYQTTYHIHGDEHNERQEMFFWSRTYQEARSTIDKMLTEDPNLRWEISTVYEVTEVLEGSEKSPVDCSECE